MTWGRMDDKFHRNRKVRELRQTRAGREALGAWAFWWSWCLNDPELTGEVSNVDLSTDDRKSAELLVHVELWERTANGFKFHDFHEYNPTKKQRLAKLENDRRIASDSRSGHMTNNGPIARDVAIESRATSHPRARAGHGNGYV